MKGFQILAALIVISGPALAEQTSQAAPPPGSEPRVTTSVNLNAGSRKLSLCFWGSAVYSPGSRLDYFDVSKKADACFHCNADGTWDTPCQ